MKIKIATLSAVLLLAPQFSSAKEAGLPGEFLNFGVGARAMGMGRAFTGVADDVDALYWNPAGLGTFRSSQVSFQYTPLEIDGAYSYIGYSAPLYSLGNFGVGIVNLDSGDVTKYSATDTGGVPTKVGNFDARETAYLVSYADRFNDWFATGATLKMAENSIDGTTERGFGLDWGNMFILGEKGKVGLMLRNLIAPKYSFSSDDEEFPRIARLGGSYQFFDGHLTTALDLEKTIDTDQALRPHFGLEGYVIRNIFLRAGWDDTAITAGLGIRWRTIQFDYAGGFQDVGYQNRFAMKFFFGGYDVDVKADREDYSPTGLRNKLQFNIDTSHRFRIVKWTMSIRDGKNVVIKTFQGFNDPPRVVEWDGRDSQGQVVPPGRYTFQMVITDSKGRIEKTPIRAIKVLAPTPFEIEAK